MELQENLIRLRHRRHLSQEQLAEQLGVARQTVSRWEVGTVIPTADNLLALGNAVRRIRGGTDGRGC